MLSAIREKTQGIIATIILSLVIIPFALWGTYSYFQGSSNVNVATVDGTNISQQTYRLALDRLLGSNIRPEVLQSPEFKRQVLDNLIEQTLLVQNGVDQGYRVSDAELASMIRNEPQFKRDDQFDPTIYQAVLRREGLTEQSFEQRLRTVQIASQIQAGFRESALPFASEKNALLRLWLQQREFEYVVVGSARFISGSQVSEDAIKQYYESHPDQFKTPEQVRIAYIQLSVGNLARDYQPTEEQLRKAFTDEQGRYSTPDQRRISHILIEVPSGASKEDEAKALEKARAIEKKLRAGGDFAALAKENSADSATAGKGGDLGVVEPGALPKALEEAVKKLKPGEITQPVRTSFGYHIAKLTEYTPGTHKTFEQARADVEKLLRNRKAEEEFYQKVERLSNLAYEHSESLAPAAEQLGLKVSQSDWFSREGGPGIAANPKIVEAAFSPEVLQESRNSEAIELGQDKLVALRVTGHREASRKPLADVRGEIQTVLQRQQAEASASKLGSEIYAKLRENQSLAELAKANGLNLEQAQISRIDPKTVDRQLVTAVFKARVPQADKPVFGEVDLQATGYAVFVLKSVKEVAPAEANDALVRRVETVLQQRHGAELYRDYLTRLRETADIKIYADNL
jgi:peptidyl-prolyl cis-trans isomerase D